MLRIRGIKFNDLVKNKIVSAPTIRKLRNNQNVCTDVLIRLCDYLGCNLFDIVAYVPDQKTANDFEPVRYVTYDKLFKRLKRIKRHPRKLIRDNIITEYTLKKLYNDEEINIDQLIKIGKYLRCNPFDLVEYLPAVMPPEELKGLDEFAFVSQAYERENDLYDTSQGENG